MLDQDLMDAIGFTADDLKTNRSGTISPKQRLVLRRKLIRGWHWAYALTSLLLAGTALVAIGRGDTSGLVWGTVGAGLLAVVTVFSLVLRWTQVRTDLETGDIIAVSGKLSGALHRTECYLQVGGIRFDVSRAIFRAFDMGEHYLVYYASNSKIILSAEPIKAQTNPS